ncbi:hypothetical protein JHK87_050323 [Glycine soja]|nr:hypothetical protein JHK87_050323 [Glycine soja]
MKGFLLSTPKYCSWILCPLSTGFFSMVLQHERQHTLNPTPMDELNSFVNAADKCLTSFFNKNCSSDYECSKGNSSQDVEKSNKVCTYCGQTKHTINECYAKHSRYPGRPCYRNRSSNSTVNSDTASNIEEGDKKEEASRSSVSTSLQLSMSVSLLS